jgi:hypothetical protein
MKIRLVLLLFILGVSIYLPAEAQLLKKLVKHAEEKVKNETERRSKKRVDKGIDKVFDDTEREIDENIKGKSKKKEKRKRSKKKNNAAHDVMIDEFNTQDVKLEGIYHFTWKYVLEADSPQLREHTRHSIRMTYYLSPNTRAVAMENEMYREKGDGIGLIDPEKDIQLSLYEYDEKKTAILAPRVNINNKSSQSSSAPNVSFKKIGKKKIMGYTCQGVKGIVNNMIIIYYFTTEAPVSFDFSLMQNVWFGSKGFNPAWMYKHKKGLMMEMQIISDKISFKITCKALKKHALTIDLSKYELQSY